jgi:hypothetical protein
VPSDYTREKGERFHSKGLRTGSPADALQPGQYPYLQNVRGTTESELTTRAGHVLDFSTEANPVEQIAAYADATGKPRLLAKTNTSVYLDNGSVVDTGYSTGVPSMIPLRPNQSPLPWMYVGDGTQYRKLSAPNATNVVTAQNVGIQEPLSPPTAILHNSPSQLVYALDASGNWSNSGACGSVSNGTRSTDTAGAIFVDPNNVVGAGVASIEVHDPIIYQQWEQVNWVDSISGLVVGGIVLDVFTPLPSGIAIDAIHYFSGSTGKCVIVPKIIAPGPGNDMSQYEQTVLASLRRGAIVKVGSEECYVQDVEVSPYGSICFTTSTTGTHTTAETLSGVQAIQLDYTTAVAALTPGTTISSYQWQFHCNSGIGTVQENLISGLFFSFGANVPFQPDDYLSFGVYLVNPENLIEMKVVINVTAGSVDYTADTFFYAVRQSDIQAGLQNTLTQLGVSQIYAQRQLIQNEADAGHVAASTQSEPGAKQWSQILIRLRDLIRTGSDQTQTLSNMLGIQFIFNCTGSGTDVAISSIQTMGQLQLDVGTIGQPILYRVRGRSSVTGARSNPSPPTRYGWSPRRQGIWIQPPSSPDPQIDLWDVFRIGGTLDTYRLVGTVDTVTQLQDDYPDTMIAESEALDYDNLQPWPTIDYPLSVSSATVSGYVVIFTLPGGDPHLATITRYLPGNLVRINETVYTLYTRPTLSGTTVTFLLNECAGSGTSPLFIYEPQIANEPLPFLWGPSAEGGTMFGAGDSFRPGNVSFAKNFNPDSAPDRYNLELSPPSEPVTGGCLLNGESFAFTASRCWALRPSFGGVNQYTPRQVPTGVGAINHFGICSDGKHIYFVAKNGIYSTAGGPATPLTTRANIYTLFPHEGQDGQPWTYAGYTVNPPLLFNTGPVKMELHLTYANGYLYFDYKDVVGNFQHLVYDIQMGAWYPDKFVVNLTTHYALPQEDPNASTLVLAGDVNGEVLTETANTTDNGNALACVVATREYCPDDRAFSWFGDCGIDLLPTAHTAMTAEGISLGSHLGTPTTFPTSIARQPLATVDLGGGQTLKSLGLLLIWSQTYTAPEVSPVTLYAWQPAWVPKAETSDGRYTDWHPRPAVGNRFWQGLLIEADTYNVGKIIRVRNGDTGAVMQTFPAVTFNGQQQQALSFTTPFVAHTVRLEPADSVPWRLFNVEWKAVPYPEACLTWRTEGTAHSYLGLRQQIMRHYQYLYMGELSYISTQPVNVIFRFDQISPITITLPATGVQLDPVKAEFKIPPNKFKIVSYEANSTAPFYLWESNCEMWVGHWGRVDVCEIVRPFGGMTGHPEAQV